MQVVITIEGSQADVFEQEPTNWCSFDRREYTCVDGCGMLTIRERADRHGRHAHDHYLHAVERRAQSAPALS